jgi:hypothetical protein
MDYDSSPSPSPTRHRVWLVGVILVVGSCLVAVVHLSTGLHAQLLANRKMVRALRDQLVSEAEEREALLKEKDVSMSKTATLRTKSKLVTDELLDQQRKSKHLQQELLLARDDLQVISKNCTLATQRLRDRFDVTLRALHDRVVHGQECRALLERNIEERAKLETSLSAMQDRAYNVTLQLKTTRQKLREVVTLASQQRDEINTLRRELEQMQERLVEVNTRQQQQQQSSTSNGESTSTTESGNNDSNTNNNNNEQQSTTTTTITNNENTGETTSPEDVLKYWKEHVDPKSGKTFYYNSKLKKSQWTSPF